MKNNASRVGNTLRPLVRRWWPLGVLVAVTTGWIVWCLHDGLAGIFAPAVGMFGCGCILGCGPRWKPNTNIDGRISPPKGAS